MDADATCYRHADRSAAVACQRCERPICPDCMRSASVGHHCPECVKAGSQRVFRPGDLARRPKVTVGLIAVLVLIFFVQAADAGGVGRAGLSDYWLFGPYVADNRWWVVITGGFLHANLQHIAFNGFSLWIFGRYLEEGLGWRQMLLVYAGGLAGGSAAVLAFDWAQPTLGASGAVLGLAGGMAAILNSRGIGLNQTSLGGIFLINLGLPLLIGGISFWGHAGGIVGGALVGAVIGYAPQRLGWNKATTEGAAVAVIVGLLAGAIALGRAGGLV